MKDPPKVSVVIPSCGRASIRAAIESVLSQSVTDLEIIVVVDPGCREYGAHGMLGSMRNERLRIELPELSEYPAYLPARIGKLRNLGIANARGAYIAHLDDDNWWSVDHLEHLVALLDSDASIGAAYSWRVIVDQRGDPFPLHTYPWSTRFDNRDQIFARFLEYGMATRGEPCLRDVVIAENGDPVFHVDTSEWCMRREVHENIRFPERFTLRQMIEGHGEDRVLCEEIYEQGVRYGCSGKYSLFYRVGGYSNEAGVAP